MTNAALAWLGSVPLAHRGLCAAGSEPLRENSLAAFARSAAAGHGCELDVRLAADGVPVVVHDAMVSTPDGRRVRVARTTAEQLLALGVPTLDAALEVLARRPVMVELKQARVRVGALEAATLAALVAHGRSRDDVVIASFNPWTLAWFARNAPGLPRALTVGRVATRTVLSGPVLAWVRPQVVSVAVGVSALRRVRRLRSARTVLAWTVRNRTDAERVRSHVDNIIFEGALDDVRAAA